MIHVHDILILRAEGAVLCRSDPQSIACPLIDSRDVQAAHAAVEYQISEARLAQRLRNQLRFFRFDVDGKPVATAWAVCSGGRYIDELNWHLPFAVGDLWLRDVWIAPSWRGRKLFADLVAALTAQQSPGVSSVWSDVDRVNLASTRAHKSAGFHCIARVRALDFMGRLRLRSALPAWPQPVLEIDPRSRWIWLRGERLQRHHQLLA